MHLISTAALALVLTSASNVDPRSEQALVEEVRTINARANARPTHVAQPLSGTFAERAAPYFERLAPRFKGKFRLVSDELYPVLTGGRAWADASTAARTLVDEALPDIEGILEASHARSGRLPSNLTGLLNLSDPMPEDSAMLAMRIAALQAARLAPTAPSEALRYCIDGLAVARDLSYGNAIGRMYAASAMGWFQQGCVHAFEATRPGEETCSALSRIASHVAPLSEMFEQEKIFIELTGYGETLSDATRAALPPEAQRIVDGHALSERADVRFSKVRTWLFGSWARKDFATAMNDLVAVADRAPAESDPALANFDEQHQALSFTLVGSDDSPSNWLKFARRWRESQTRLNLIVSACSVLADKPASGWPAHPQLGTDARSGQPLRFEADDDHQARLIADGDPTRDAKRVELGIADP